MFLSVIINILKTKQYKIIDNMHNMRNLICIIFFEILSEYTYFLETAMYRKVLFLHFYVSIQPSICRQINTFWRVFKVSVETAQQNTSNQSKLLSLVDRIQSFFFNTIYFWLIITARKNCLCTNDDFYHYMKIIIIAKYSL